MQDDLTKAALIEALRPYCSYAKVWWEERQWQYAKHLGPAIIDDPRTPTRMYLYVARTPNQSKVKGIQCFPMISPTDLAVNITLPEGRLKALGEFCEGDEVCIDGIRVLERAGMRVGLRASSNLCFIDDAIYQRCRAEPQYWMYVTVAELRQMSMGVVPVKTAQRAEQLLKQAYLDMPVDTSQKELFNAVHNE